MAENVQETGEKSCENWRVVEYSGIGDIHSVVVADSGLRNMSLSCCYFGVYEKNFIFHLTIALYCVKYKIERGEIIPPL